MTQTHDPGTRPATRRHTAGSQKRADKELDQGFRITVEDSVYELRFGDVTPTLARELRRYTGMGFLGLIRAINEDADVDLISAAVWLARRAAGERVNFAAVEVGYAQFLSDDFDISVTDTAGSTEDQDEASLPDPGSLRRDLAYELPLLSLHFGIRPADIDHMTIREVSAYRYTLAKIQEQTNA